MSSELLDVLRSLAKRKQKAIPLNGENESSVERYNERNEITHQMVEDLPRELLTVSGESTAASAAQISEMAESLDPSTQRKDYRGNERNEINEEIQGCVGGVLDWLDRLSRLDPDCPPEDVPLGRWRQLIDAHRQLVLAGSIAEAARLGWTSLDLFGCNRDKPFARIDQMGLVWFVKGGRIVSLSMSAAVIEAPAGARQTYRRKVICAGQVPVWELFQRKEKSHEG